MRKQQEISLELNNRFIGKKLNVIIDSINDGNAIARTMFDAPEVDGNVFLENVPELLPGTIVNVEITDADIYDLYGKILN